LPSADSRGSFYRESHTFRAQPKLYKPLLQIMPYERATYNI